MSQLGATISAEANKSAVQNESDGNPTATDVQVPDAPARTTVAENVASNKGEHVLPPEDTEAQKCAAATKDTVETSEEQLAEEEPQGEPVPP